MAAGDATKAATTAAGWGSRPVLLSSRARARFRASRGPGFESQAAAFLGVPMPGSLVSEFCMDSAKQRCMPMRNGEESGKTPLNAASPQDLLFRNRQSNQVPPRPLALLEFFVHRSPPSQIPWPSGRHPCRRILPAPLTCTVLKFALLHAASSSLSPSPSTPPR